MTTKVKIHNPYWEEVKDLPQADPLFAHDGQRMLARWPRDPVTKMAQYDTPYSRDDFVVKYSWTVSSPEALDFIVGHLKGRSVVDFGAGTGYWAYLLSQHGVFVECYDKAPVLDAENHYHSLHKGAVQWHEVTQGGPEVLSDPSHSDQVLFLSWPPYDDPMAAEALKAFSGNTLIYIGEGSGGCTGDSEFHKLLGAELYDWETDEFVQSESEWELVDEFLPVQWEGLHDYIYVYQRRGT